MIPLLVGGIVRTVGGKDMIFQIQKLRKHVQDGVFFSYNLVFLDIRHNGKAIVPRQSKTQLYIFINQILRRYWYFRII